MHVGLQVPAELWNFPDRSTAIGQMINAYLASDSELDDASIHLLFSANRWEKRWDLTFNGRHPYIVLYSNRGNGAVQLLFAAAISTAAAVDQHASSTLGEAIRKADRLCRVS